MEVSLFRLSKKSHGKFSLADIILYGGPQLSPQNQKPHDKTKNLTAKTTYTSRQHQKPHGKITKVLTAKPNTSEQKPNTSRQKQILRQNQSYFAFAVKYLVLPWGFWFCREVFCFCREVFGFAVMFLFLQWGFWFCREVFVFAVRFLVLPWQLWATIGLWLFGRTRSLRKNATKGIMTFSE